jgi:hypothetical protein
LLPGQSPWPGQIQVRSGLRTTVGKPTPLQRFANQRLLYVLPLDDPPPIPYVDQRDAFSKIGGVFQSSFLT